VKPYEKAFIQTMLNPILCKIFCNIVVDTHLIDILKYNQKFLHTFALIYGKDMVYVDNQSDREKVKALVKSDSNAGYIKATGCEECPKKLMQEKERQTETERQEQRKNNDVIAHEFSELQHVSYRT
jgi:hypothetical protein